MIHPEIKEWVEGFQGGVDYIDFVSSRVNLADWVAISRVFHPSFIEVEDCILWDRVYDPENFRAWKRELNGDATSIELVLNQLRLWQVIDFPEDELSQKISMEVAKEISFFWRSSLERGYPDRNFDVSVASTEDGPVVRFVTLR
ncbi:hypothetical protein GCM10010420_47850 [Streptomyces glaucosporus]|uniref:Uncharacterized protein n=1 Tax=Streptomyces glaucosporus TaxID=284044 RepID=A0ABN3ISS4_9ACTN